MAPSEFWAMSPQEFWAIAEARRPPEKIGNLSADQFEELRALLPKEQKP
jgi:hypothetical protein